MLRNFWKSFCEKCGGCVGGVCSMTLFKTEKGRVTIVKTLNAFALAEGDY